MTIEDLKMDMVKERLKSKCDRLCNLFEVVLQVKVNFHCGVFVCSRVQIPVGALLLGDSFLSLRNHSIITFLG